MLEDLPILDMLQIVGFSTKTGYLRVDSPSGPGVVVFKDGRIHCAVSPSTWDHVRRVASDLGAGAALLARCNEVALRELAQLRKGSFEFDLTEQLDASFGGVELGAFLEGPGLNVQHSLLDLSREMDEERREAVAIVTAEGDDGAAPGPDAPAAPDAIARQRVVLVDDEPEVLRVVGAELQRLGYGVARANDPKEGWAQVELLRDSNEAVVVVADLKMPTTAGDSFLGGFELVERIRGGARRYPVILMAESLPAELRQQAVTLGVRKVTFKPTLTKPDPELYRDDLLAFARELARQLEKIASASDPSGVEDAYDPAEPERNYVAAMSARIAEPHRESDLTRVVLESAEKWFERAVLFLVRGDAAAGFSAFGISDDRAEGDALARQLRVSLRLAPTFGRVVRTARVHGPTDRLEDLEAPIYSRIGQGQARHGVLFPILTHGEVIMILYADNPRSGEPAVKPRALELILAHAGSAVESLLLERKLDGLRTSLVTERVL